MPPVTIQQQRSWLFIIFTQLTLYTADGWLEMIFSSWALILGLHSERGEWDDFSKADQFTLASRYAVQELYTYNMVGFCKCSHILIYYDTGRCFKLNGS